MLRRIFGKVAIMASLLAGVAGESLAAAPNTWKSAVGKQVDDFSLRDIYGKTRTLAEFDASAVVVVFLGADCPLAKLYAPRLESLQSRFRERGVAFVAINANVQDSLTEVAAHARHHGLTFPVVKDADQQVARKLQATRTPEAYLLDRQHVVRYHGRIDDQYAVGAARPKVQHEHLAAAIEELLSGKPITVSETEPTGCPIDFVEQKKPTGDLTYYKHVAPILNARCVECHRDGEIAPFPLARYEDLPGWGATIVEVIESKRMPPWNANPEFGHFRNDARLSDAERTTLLTWIQNGMPAGDPADAPPPPRFVEGWRMPQPDQVIAIREQPVEIPAEGTINYQYFEVDPGWTEDKFITAAEARPDNRAVVHHIIAFIKAPGDDDFRKRGILVGYAPGSDPAIYSNGLVRHVPAGSKIVFEMHYTANGSPQKDRSFIGLKFVDKSQVKKVVQNGFVANNEFKIPPQADNFEVKADRKLPRDVLLLSLTPHMHVRGKSFRYEATYPDGRREVLLDVPRYDFNWQLSYELAEPKLLPKGTRLDCFALFDNSADNVSNPDPTKEVRWGDQSWEEMMIGFFDLVTP